jgi:hypothetical protein
MYSKVVKANGYRRLSRADELVFSQVDLFCGAIIPTERVGEQKMIPPKFSLLSLLATVMA